MITCDDLFTLLQKNVLSVYSRGKLIERDFLIQPTGKFLEKKDSFPSGNSSTIGHSEIARGTGASFKFQPID